MKKDVAYKTKKMRCKRKKQTIVGLQEKKLDRVKNKIKLVTWGRREKKKKNAV